VPVIQKSWPGLQKPHFPFRARLGARHGMLGKLNNPKCRKLKEVSITFFPLEAIKSGGGIW
jgi:hypothetical protein